MESVKQGDEGIIVIGAGLPRTGTNTLQNVLQELLGKPCYHGYEIFKKTDHIEFWNPLLKGEKKSKQEWKTFLKGYGAGVDMPVCLFYKEIMDVYPNAKVLLSVRDPDKWYESYVTSVILAAKFRSTWRGRIYWKILRPKWKKLPEFLCECRRLFLGDNWREENKEDYLYHYRKHVEEVKRTVPADKLLVYSVHEGYAPLCKFLGLPVREGNLPRLNDGNSFRRTIFIQNIISWSVVIGLLIFLAGGAWLISSYL